MRKNLSTLGTMKCNIHFHPCSKVLSAVAMALTESTPETERGVVLAVDSVDVADVDEAMIVKLIGSELLILPAASFTEREQL